MPSIYRPYLHSRLHPGKPGKTCCHGTCRNVCRNDANDVRCHLHGCIRKIEHPGTGQSYGARRIGEHQRRGQCREDSCETLCFSEEGVRESQCRGEPGICSLPLTRRKEFSITRPSMRRVTNSHRLIERWSCATCP